MSELNLEKNGVTKGWAKYYLTAEINFGFERLTVPVFSYGMSAILAKLYKEDEGEYKKALQRHLVFYDSETVWGSVTFGTACALEEERAIMLQERVGSEELKISVDMVNNLRVGLMGPLAGIGDTINHGMLRLLLLSMFIPLATEGNWLASVGPLLVWGAAIAFLVYTLVTRDCTLSKKSVVPIPKSGKPNQFIKTANVLGLFMMGTLFSTCVKLVTPISWIDIVGEEQLLQNILNKISPNILPLLAVFDIYFYTKKSGPKYMHILVSILVLPMVFFFFGIV